MPFPDMPPPPSPYQQAKLEEEAAFAKLWYIRLEAVRQFLVAASTLRLVLSDTRLTLLGTNDATAPAPVDTFSWSERDRRPQSVPAPGWPHRRMTDFSLCYATRTAEMVFQLGSDAKIGDIREVLQQQGLEARTEELLRALLTETEALVKRARTEAQAAVNRCADVERHKIATVEERVQKLRDAIGAGALVVPTLEML